MQLKKKALMGGVAVVAATATVLVSTTAPASADPTRNYAATGSDTIQDVWNGLSNDFGAPIPSVASYNAFEGNPAADPAKSFVQTKSGGAWFLRPSGSTAGVTSLSAVWDSTFTSHLYPTTGGQLMNHEDVDFARSSSGPSNGNGLKYIPFARDAVSVAFNPSGALTGLNLTTAQIAELYSGVDATGDGVVTFSEQPANQSTVVRVNNVVVHPKIPQSASGTRSFFLGAIGVAAGGSTPALAPYISDPGTAAQGGLAENDGSVLSAAGDMIPFSAAQWISQANGKVVDSRSGLEMASINGGTPFTGTAPALTPGTLFGGKNLSGDYNTLPTSGVGTFNRDTYSVVPDLFRTGTGKQQALVSILGGSGAGAVYSGGAKNVIRSFGFGTLSYGTDTANWRNGAFRH